MDTRWYVEHYDLYDTHNGGFHDIDGPFETEPEARAFAEAQTDEVITLYRVDNNVFAEVDSYTAGGDRQRPAGWHAAVTPAQLAAHVEALRQKDEQEQRDLEASGQPVMFWVVRRSGYAHNCYSTRAEAEAVIGRIRERYPDGDEPHVRVTRTGGGMFLMPYKDVE